MNWLRCNWLTFVLLAGVAVFSCEMSRASDEPKGDAKKADKAKAADGAKAASATRATEDAKQKAEDARRKAESAKKRADEAIREANRLADEAKRAEDAAKPAAKNEGASKKKDEAVKKTDDSKKKEDATKKADDARRAEEAHKAEEARRAESAKKRADEAARLKAADEDARKKSEANRKAEEARKIESAKKKADEAAKLKADNDAKQKAEAAKTLEGLHKDRDGFALLFSGKDLANWFVGGDSKATLDGKTEAAEKRYAVQKDALVVSGDGKGMQSLRNVKQLKKKVQLKFEFRPVNDGACTFNIGGYGLMLRDFTKSTGSHRAVTLKGFKPGDWNSVEIAVEMGSYTASADQTPLTEKDAVEVVIKEGRPSLKVNGKTLETNHFQFHRSPIATIKCNGEDLQKGSFNPHGPFYQISLRGETGKVEIRNLRVKEVN